MVLAFPSGRLTSPIDRTLAAVAFGLVATLFLPTARVARYPTSSPFASCYAGCPQNAFMLTSHAPALIAGFLEGTTTGSFNEMTFLNGCCSTPSSSC